MDVFWNAEYHNQNDFEDIDFDSQLLCNESTSQKFTVKKKATNSTLLKRLLNNNNPVPEGDCEYGEIKEKRQKMETSPENSENLFSDLDLCNENFIQVSEMFEQDSILDFENNKFKSTQPIDKHVFQPKMTQFMAAPKNETTTNTKKIFNRVTGDKFKYKNGRRKRERS